MQKTCTKCNTVRPIEDFYKRSNGVVASECKLCHKEYYRKYSKQNRDKLIKKSKEWQTANKERRKIIKQRWIEKNPDYHKQYRDQYYLSNPNYNKEYYWKDPEKHKKSSKKFRRNNPRHIIRYTKQKLSSDVSFRIAYNMRHRIIYAIKLSKTSKITKTTKLLGCSISELKQYLESKFLPTMTWDNYGKYWQVDHIIPCSSFDLTIAEEQAKCFHYTNLQPLFTVTTVIDGVEYMGNINKGNRTI